MVPFHRLIRRTLAAAVISAGLATTAHATPIPVDGGWYTFCLNGSGSPASTLSPVGGSCPLNSGVGLAGNTITFSSLFPTVLQVTDAFIAGEDFLVVIDGVSYFTPSVQQWGAVNVFDPNAAFADARYSHGSWTLAAGSHRVDIFAQTVNNGGGGAAYVQVITSSTTVPEPSTYALMLSGLLAIGATTGRFRRKTARVAA
jgi:PEP-CTERM motif